MHVHEPHHLWLLAKLLSTGARTVGLYFGSNTEAGQNGRIAKVLAMPMQQLGNKMSLGEAVGKICHKKHSSVSARARVCTAAACRLPACPRQRLPCARAPARTSTYALSLCARSAALLTLGVMHLQPVLLSQMFLKLRLKITGESFHAVMIDHSLPPAEEDLWRAVASMRPGSKFADEKERPSVVRAVLAPSDALLDAAVTRTLKRLDGAHDAEEEEEEGEAPASPATVHVHSSLSSRARARSKSPRGVRLGWLRW